MADLIIEHTGPFRMGHTPILGIPAVYGRATKKDWLGRTKPVPICTTDWEHDAMRIADALNRDLERHRL